MNLYKVKYIDSVKPRVGHVIAKSYGEAESKITKANKALVMILNMEQVASEGMYGKPGMLIN